jgi:hypothetical protein
LLQREKIEAAMSAGTGSCTFRRRDWSPLGHLLGTALRLLLPVALLLALTSASGIPSGYGVITNEPAFRGTTAVNAGAGYLDLHTLERQLTARIDQQQGRRGVWVTTGLCEQTSEQSASCGFFGSDGSTATIPAYISEDGRTYWTPASDAP